MTPIHPLVIDRVTGKVRLVTQDDIHLMEAICAAYASIVDRAQREIEQAAYLKDRLKNVYQ
jgi:type IV secretory pathway TrbF-like protein